jgi:hypothetical protein
MWGKTSLDLDFWRYICGVDWMVGRSRGGEGSACACAPQRVSAGRVQQQRQGKKQSRKQACMQVSGEAERSGRCEGWVFALATDDDDIVLRDRVQAGRRGDAGGIKDAVGSYNVLDISCV